MTQPAETMEPETAAAPVPAGPLPTFEGLGPLAERLASLDTQLVDVAASPDSALATTARKMRKQIRDFEPSITMIGQVKAGKTTLVNAMAGWSDLLPADVNPWTSVVTSLHLDRHLPQSERRSAFRFFTNDEWDHLIRQGGRVGEIAARAGAEDELEKVRRQLDEMREKSRARLGRKFQMLLGQTHDYDTFDEALIQRYVCLGDDFWDEEGANTEQGRFADITKSADLWFARPDTPVNICIQDTPGVNDTFMIREQITINALRGARLCVMVLSAQQALSSVDLGLIRMISNVKSRDVIIFVNRIDELSNPVTEVPEIRASIEETLRKFDGPADAEIIFGSGFWASHAVAGTYEKLSEDSADALLSWAEAKIDEELAQKTSQEIIWHLSGLAALGDAISARIEAGAGARLEDTIARALGNLRTGQDAYASLAGPDGGVMHACALTVDEINAALDKIEARAQTSLDKGLSKAEGAFSSRTENARRTFLGRATSSLVKHLEEFGEGEVWTYDPSGLRMLLRSAFKVYVQSSSRAAGDVYQATADSLSKLYGEAFDLAEDGPVIAPPQVPQADAPVALGQTIALDLKGSWWTRFWRKRRGYQAFAKTFSGLIHEETAPIVDALRRENADPFAETCRATLAEFIATQRGIITGLAGSGDRRKTTNAG